MGVAPIHEAAPRQEFQDVVPALENLALKRLSASDDVAHRFLRFGRDAHHREFSGAIEPGELGCIAGVVLALHAGPSGDEGWRDYLARHAPAGHRSLHELAGTAGLVAGAKLTVGTEAFTVPAESGQIRREAIDVSGGVGVGR
jgi:hypothetical protein